MPTPLISVIVPVFNCERFVAEALQSVLAQDYPNLELVVVDDGSTDATPDVVRSVHPKVRLVCQRNLGPAAARNRGIRESHGEYLAFLDGDDVWLPGKLAAQMAHLQALPSCPIVFTQFAPWRADAQGHYRNAPELLAERKSWLGSEPWSGWL
jgi:glycosyltransferase involved in cell wall biosynthesis